MKNKFETFPILNQDSLKELQPEFYIDKISTRSNIKLELQKLDESKTYYIQPKVDSWDLTKESILMDGRIELSNTNILFDGKNKIANKDTKIGIALNCYSTKSKFNFSKPIGTYPIKYNEVSSSNEYKFEFKNEFSPNYINEKFSFEILLYIKEAPSKSELYASEEGTILGSIGTYEFYVEGNGSAFPIKYIEDKNAPLWTMNFDHEALMEEFSSSNVCININRKHKDFKLLGVEKISSNNEVIWKEILSSFYTQIFEILIINNELKEVIREQYDEGTVGLFLKYLIDLFDINENNNPITINQQIKLKIDELFK